jgi:hypothetical protein
MVNFMPHLLYPRGKNPLYSVSRRPGGPQYRPGRFEEVLLAVLLFVQKTGVIQKVKTIARHCGTNVHCRVCVAENVGSRMRDGRGA